MTKYVRIKPFNPQKGFKSKTYTFQSQIFREEKGWYEVSDKLAAKLVDITNEPYNPESKPVFDVCTPEEAQALEDFEARKAVERAAAKNPHRVHNVKRMASDVGTRNVGRLAPRGYEDTTLRTHDLPKLDEVGRGDEGEEEEEETEGLGDELPGDENDLDSADLSAVVASTPREAGIPGAPKSTMTKAEKAAMYRDQAKKATEAKKAAAAEAKKAAAKKAAEEAQGAAPSPTTES